MTRFNIRRIEFLGKYISYFTVIGDDCFISTHDRTGLSDEQAKGYFRDAHDKEVLVLMQQKRQREQKVN